MNQNFQVNRSVINYIHARDYFPKGEIEAFRPLVEDVHWVDTKFGKQMAHWNMIFKDIDLVLGKMVGDLVEIDRPNSGTLWRPLHEIIHFEDFENLDDWRFVVAMDTNEFKTYVHKSGWKSFLDFVNDPDPEKAMPNYTDPDEWHLETFVRLNPNDVLFYRPWIWHSFQSGVLHYYKLKVI